jgi:AMP-polyphosphate phosphotransferase
MNFAKDIEHLQEQLTKIQQCYIQQGLRAVIVLEGVDAAGKGGLIRRLAWSMDPRTLKVWPIGAPEGLEKDQHYMQRFWRRLPSKGQIAVFDRSWYGRVLVEKVEGFATFTEVERAYKEIVSFEKTLADNGIRMIKILLKISKAEQARRFRERLEDTTKHWKLTFEDFRNRKKWGQYERAYQIMIERTSTRHATWTVIDTDSKQEGRSQALRWIVKNLSNGVSLKPMKPAPELYKMLKSI